MRVRQSPVCASHTHVACQATAHQQHPSLARHSMSLRERSMHMGTGGRAGLVPRAPGPAHTHHKEVPAQHQGAQSPSREA